MTTIFRRLLAAVLAATAVMSHAQPDPLPQPVSQALDPRLRVPPATYRSSLAQYRRFTEEPVGSWQRANETVNRIGGWRTYAREAQAAEPPASAASRP